ncbi:MAG: hypothetical protein WC091_06260 [Sulfuricellaceae bacterium]
MSKEVKNLLHLLIDIALFCLMFLGVVGTIFKFLNPNGWLQAWVHEIWRFSPGYILTGAVLALIALLLIKRWLGSLNAKTFLGDLIMYAWVALGLYYAVTLALTGSW